MELIDKAAIVAEIEKQGTIQPQLSWFTDKLIQIINSSVEVKEVNLEKIIEQTYHDRSVTDTSDMDHVDYENIARYFFELGLKQSSSDEYILGESEIYLDDDGGEPPYDGKEWLDLSCMEYEIPYDKFKAGDKIEIVIRKIKKGE